MARSRQPALARTTYAAETLADFTGGLNLGPVQQIPANCVTLARDVDFNARGGFTKRNGIVPFDANIIPAADSIYISGVHNRVDDGVQQVIAFSNAAHFVYWSDGGGWFTIDAAGGWGNTPHIAAPIGGIAFKDGIFATVQAQFGDKSYFQNGAGSARRWNGYVANTLGVAFNDNFGAPVGGNMPKARCIAAHREYVFIGYTDDLGTNVADIHPRRIRWSHPGQPEDWRTLDFIDIPQGAIRALVPFQDYLMVFTDDEIYGVYGSSSDDFSLQRLSGDTGTPWAKSVAKGPGKVYWWDWDQGLMMYDGKRILSTFGPMAPALQSGGFSWGVAQNGLDDIPEVFAGDGKVFVAKQVTPTDLGLTLVYDPNVGRAGAWTTYDWAGTSIWYGARGIVQGMASIQRPSNLDVMVVGLGQMAYVTNDSNYDLDYLKSGDRTLQPTSPNWLVRTSPMEGSTNATNKRFRRPRMAFTSGATQSLRYRWVRDYDPTAAAYAKASDYLTILLDNVTNRPTDYMVWDGVGAKVATFPTTTTPAATKTLVTTANATASSVATGSFAVSDNEVIVVMFGAYDNAGTAMVADISETFAATLSFSTKQFQFINGGKSAVMGGFITKIPVGGAGSGTVTVNTPNGDDIAIAVYRLTNAQPRFSHRAWGGEIPAAGGVGTGTLYGDASIITANDLNFISVVLAELTNSDVDVVGTGYASDIEDNNANNIINLGSKNSQPGSSGGGFVYVSGTNSWGVHFDLTVQAVNYATASDGIWNTDLWGGGLTHEFVSFATQPSAGAGHVVQLEMTDTNTTDAALQTNGTIGVNDSIGLDSTVLPYREKGLR